MKKIKQRSLLLLLISSTVIFSCENQNNFSKIKFINGNYNFGTLSIKDTLTHTFFLKNISKNKLLIRDAISSCGCTTIEFSKDAIVKNDSAKITVQFIPDKLGYSEKTIVVEANTNPPYNILTLKGDIKE
ncbi:DUF1573 domain-containing protein [uncultured Psychroserpens sp.]|uniref:DUF1573 domain-containing protein n=1 Tax=uncultured Psychroserpens sp. TaxID=255436 RepID=UPI00262EF044|nr:DUF1573 domain-containing protein [uncultured Psychroserpens sp.]